MSAPDPGADGPEPGTDDGTETQTDGETEPSATEAGHPAEPDSRPQWLTDIVLVGKVLVLTYVVFTLFGLALGLDTNGIVSTLQQVTFFAAVYALLALSLNLHWGYTGLFNIGVAGFMAVGVYAMALLSSPGQGLGLPLWVGVIGGMIAAALVGLVAALPALRLRADYFAIVTLGLSEIIRLSLLSASLRSFEIGGQTLGTGGGSGISFPAVDGVIDYVLYTGGQRGADPALLGSILFPLGETVGVQSSVVRSSAYTLLLVVFVALFYLLLSRIAYSPFGRVLKAIREDEVAAQSLGKHTSLAKVKVFMLGCALMGLAGILWQGSRGYVTPSQFMPIVTFYIFVALIVGGSGSNTGSIVGGLAFAAALWEGPPFVRRIVRANVDVRAPTTIYDALTPLASLDPLPLLGYLVGNLDEIRFMIVGIVLILLMLWRPAGLLGHRRETAAATDLSRRPGTGTGTGTGTTATDRGDLDE
ncbi:branched-chain amino acid ABC transporter permease [Natronoglomus mannanivorans]|uniref:Branched-chain amino acid ABC transporter permease n=1 Tax=Natronoglomus mannanivorans TaxID=2979990 RepID=A0AAP2YWQ4_9EURY|nr:branched-chain amino acid ABC transporter permease [Halobacteria archaeon AArc-xg1-1]